MFNLILKYCNMKKLILIVFLAAFAVACTKPVLEDYETEFEPQAIDHGEVGDDNDDDEYLEGRPN